ncbi:MAG: hypothetical protein M5U25_11405 [Planctomycetota bacterium]|nr:hypothetical protein [Planctomycetota bacterium]
MLLVAATHPRSPPRSATYHHLTAAINHNVDLMLQRFHAHPPFTERLV